MNKITLIKDGRRQEFTERAAKIAVESLGWSEIVPLKVPSEIGTRTLPREIVKPVPLVKVEPQVPASPVLPKVEVKKTVVPQVKKTQTRRKK